MKLYIYLHFYFLNMTKLEYFAYHFIFKLIKMYIFVKIKIIIFKIFES